jgi:hypothetical protein
LEVWHEPKLKSRVVNSVKYDCRERSFESPTNFRGRNLDTAGRILYGTIYSRYCITDKYEYKALIELNRSPENSVRKSIVASTNTIVFAGTLHGRLRTEELEQMAIFELGGDHSMLNLLHQLREDSEYLEILKNDLSKIWPPLTNVFTFYETVKTRVVQKAFVSDGPLTCCA